MRVKVTMVFDYELPDDPEVRQELYGTADPGLCVAIDLENDPAAFMMDTDSEATGWEIVDEA